MSTALDPLIASQLAAFGRRWRRLVILRGICSGVITLLGVMTVVAFLDLLILLPDGVRWGLSGLSYAVTAFVIWFTCLRSLLHRPGPHELARLVEKARPDLREDLLSAVELGDSRQSAQWDSEQFRSLLQTNVAERMRDLRMETILPHQLIALWLRRPAACWSSCRDRARSCAPPSASTSGQGSASKSRRSTVRWTRVTRTAPSRRRRRASARSCSPPPSPRPA